MSGCEEVDCGPCGGGPRKSKVWRILQGSLFQRKLHVVNTETGASFDLTGFGVRAALRIDRVEKGSPIVALDGTVVSPAANGWIRVRLGATKTRLLMDQGYFDVEIYKLDDPDVVYRVVQGTYRVDLEVTD